MERESREKDDVNLTKFFFSFYFGWPKEARASIPLHYSLLAYLDEARRWASKEDHRVDTSERAFAV